VQLSRPQYNSGRVMPELLVLRGTIWLAVLAWASTEVLKRAGADRRDAARWFWTAGALLLVAHTAAAFELRHGWSHAAALAETARRSSDMTGFASGSGLYLNYLLVVLWVADAAWWWIDPRGYLHRPRKIERTVYGFFLFMFVNGAVVFASGQMRIAGAAAIAAVIAARHGIRRRVVRVQP
jgi:hypothetical protein